MRYQFLTLVFVLAVGSALLGCSGGGGDEQTMTEDCRGGSINNSVNSQVSEIATGLTFDFTDGDIFHPAGPTHRRPLRRGALSARQQLSATGVGGAFLQSPALDRDAAWRSLCRL